MSATRRNVQFKPKRAIHLTGERGKRTFCQREIPEGALIWDPDVEKPTPEQTGHYLVPCQRCHRPATATFFYRSGRTETWVLR